MPTYVFGSEYIQFKTNAVNLRVAIRRFRVGALYSHAYSTDPIWDPDLDPGHGRDRVALSSKPGAVVVVYEIRGRAYVEVARIDPNGEAEELDEVGTRLVEAASVGPAHSETTSLVAAGASANPYAGLTRSEVQDRDLDIRRKLNELELARKRLEKAAAEMKAELQRRLEQVWLIELFLGSQEEVTLLREGQPASVDTKITVRQRTLCMDEEIAVSDLLSGVFSDRRRAFDASRLKDFDRWLLDPVNLESVCPWPRGVVAFRVRRHAKQRDWIENQFELAEREEADKMTYLLIRNGAQLYRLWVDVRLWPRVFPRASEWERDPTDQWASFAEKEEAARSKAYGAGLLVIAGLVQRSTLLHPLPKADINPFDPDDVAAYFNLHADDEAERVLGDGRALEHLTWRGYYKWLQGQLRSGLRVLWTGRQSTDDKLYERTNIKSLEEWPSRDEVYILEEWNQNKSHYGTLGSFLYLPNRRWEWVPERTRRIRFAVYSDEVTPVDYVSRRIVEHILHDRNQRESYVDSFPVIAAWLRFIRAEEERERPFISLALAQAGLTEKDRPRVERLVRWWKLRTQANRALAVDEAKALRMIVGALQRGQDNEDDPEFKLRYPLEGAP